MGNAIETMVRTYKDTKEYEKDQRKLAKKGWLTITMTERKPRAGIGRIATLGVFTVVRPPKPELVVTYQKGGQAPAPVVQAPVAQAPVQAAPQSKQKPSGKPVEVTGGRFCPNCGFEAGTSAFYCPNCNQQLRR